MEHNTADSVNIAVLQKGILNLPMPESLMLGAALGFRWKRHSPFCFGDDLTINLPVKFYPDSYDLEKRRVEGSQAYSTLFLLNVLMEGGIVSLKTLGDVQKAGSVYKVPDGDLLFFLGAVGFSAIPTFALWRSGNVSGHKELGLGHLFYHGLVSLYLLSKPKKPEAKGPETVIGLMHASLAVGFYNYISK
ncbi:hypothetical protein HDU93_007477 [Gonapodya sp. JEL0774]|nr:hypothetical protein HDU93_007477 [Gonapodya sp. JEL0774]